MNLIHTGMGEVTESDIMLASASDAIVVGFNVRTNPKAHALAEQEQVDVRYYDIIYNLLQDIQAALEGLLEPIVEEKVMGRAEVRARSSASTKVGTIAGCMVLDGKIERNSLARVLRKGGKTGVRRRPDQFPEALQRGRQGSPGRLRMRHRHRPVQRLSRPGTSSRPMSRKR